MLSISIFKTHSATFCMSNSVEKLKIKLISSFHSSIVANFSKYFAAWLFGQHEELLMNTLCGFQFILSIKVI